MHSESSFSLIGDLAFTGILSETSNENSIRFLKIIPFLKDHFVFANLEVPVKVDETKNEYKNSIHYSLLDPTAELLKILNIGCVSLANNHIYDCKMPGLKATIKLLDKLGVYHTGAGWLKQHIAPVIIDQSNLKIAFMAYVDDSTNPKTLNFSEILINYFEPMTVIEDIKKIRDCVDIIILSLHWGIDYSFYPTPQQRKIAKKLIDAGVDIIMGHHPHTLQPYEKYKNSHILYSLGSLTFGDYIKEGKKELHALFRKTKKGVITEYDIHKNDLKFTSTLEKKGNYIKLQEKRDFKKWSKKLWIHYRIKHHNNAFHKLYTIKERYIDRINEYFFGYYQNPIKRLFQSKNIGKIRRL